MKSFEEIKNNPRCSWNYISEDGYGGTIVTPTWSGSIIISNGAGWEHISITPFKRRITPSWEDMCFIKKQFFNDDEAVIQIHPAEADYVNNMPNCLHLWRCTYKEMVLPPSCLVGIKEGQTQDDLMKEIKEAYELAGEKY